MRPDGRSESALEQLLWAYAMGRAYDADLKKFDPTFQLTAAEANTMFRATCGTFPSRDRLNKWLTTLNRFLASIHE